MTSVIKLRLAAATIFSCTISLPSAAVPAGLAQSTSDGNSNAVPKYLELARELVATVTPENNKYEFKGPQGVRWKGDLFTSENSVKTACGGLVAAVFERAKDPTIDAIKTHIGTRYRTSAVPMKDWYEASNKGWGLKKIPSLGDVRPGDLFIFSCLDKCETSQGDAKGHIAIVDIKPYKIAPRKPLVGGADQWVVTVIDSADSAHDQNDTRHVPKGDKKITGVGRGTYRVYSDADGSPVGYTSGLGAKYHDIAMRPIVISRPSY